MFAVVLMIVAQTAPIGNSGIERVERTVNSTDRKVDQIQRDTNEIRSIKQQLDRIERAIEAQKQDQKADYIKVVSKVDLACVADIKGPFSFSQDDRIEALNACRMIKLESLQGCRPVQVGHDQECFQAIKGQGGLNSDERAEIISACQMATFICPTF